MSPIRITRDRSAYPHYAGDDVEASAVISDDGTYRYELHRWWNKPGGRLLTFVMLNPSTADATTDDPTIRRCIGFARRERYDGVAVVNLYAYRATDPKNLPHLHALAVGPDNDTTLSTFLNRSAQTGQHIVAAWGTNATTRRVDEVLALAEGVTWKCLGLTKNGHPKHPLYIPANQPLENYRTAGVHA